MTGEPFLPGRFGGRGLRQRLRYEHRLLGGALDFLRVSRVGTQRQSWDTEMAFPSPCCARLIRIVLPERFGTLRWRLRSGASRPLIRICTTLRCSRWRFHAADDFAIGDVLELKFGSELQTIQFLGRVNCFPAPRLPRSARLSQYRCRDMTYTTSLPNACSTSKSFDSTPDGSE